VQTFYYQVDSPLHRLNPLSKLLAVLPALIFVALTNDLWTPLVFICLVVLLILGVSRVPSARFIQIVGPLLLLLFGFVLFYPFAVRPELVEHTPVLLRLGPLTVYTGGILYGLEAALRACAMLLLSLFFTLTTDASDFIRAMVQQWRLPYKLGYGALAAFRFVPLLQSELSTIQAAHKIRGIADRGGIRVHYERLRRYAVPLLATAIRRAERTALAMDGRAFGALPQRTYHRQFRFRRRDYLFVGGFWLLCLLIGLIFWYTGLLGTLSLTKQI
jgi:energy-coupling factor transport system permease protein